MSDLLVFFFGSGFTSNLFQIEFNNTVKVLESLKGFATNSIATINIKISAPTTTAPIAILTKEGLSYRKSSVVYSNSKTAILLHFLILMLITLPIPSYCINSPKKICGCI